MTKRLTRREVALISEAILSRGLDIDRIGTAIGLGGDTVRMIMSGQLRPTADIRKRLAEALGIDPGLIGDV